MSAQMKSVRVPTLYLQALQDRLVPAEAGSYITSVSPEAQVISIDAPHFLLQVASDKAANIVKNFASSLYSS
ncbi:hypothetical protein GCM10011396_09640 [Undibacterium terreum]|uniref:Uncharacterized protein n=1 Tax=Undibacterium terreum TaxID=1224302 RepID=A0A916U8S0_9BURK|nr:hypothetical protein GCM10011396_09640 [Undibacterium terreum]